MKQKKRGGGVKQGLREFSCDKNNKRQEIRTT